METVLRVAAVYFLLMVGFRVMGKRELGQLSQFELVTLMLVPELVSPALNRDNPSVTNAVIGVATLFTLVILTSLVVHVFPKIGAALEGKPAVLVCHGKMDVERMNRERISPDELYSEMHQAGLERVEDVKWAILEPEGRIAFIPFDADKRAQAPEPEPIS